MVVLAGMTRLYLLNMCPLWGPNSQGVLGVLLWASMYVLVGTCAYSQVYLGANSLNQVLFGFLFGESTALIIYFVVYESLLGHLNTITAGKAENVGRHILIKVFIKLLTALKVGLVYIHYHQTPVDQTYLFEKCPNLMQSHGPYESGVF